MPIRVGTNLSAAGAQSARAQGAQAQSATGTQGARAQHPTRPWSGPVAGRWASTHRARV
jgi:hypothetical protein